MITQEEYDKIQEGDYVVVVYLFPAKDETVVAKGNVYMDAGEKCVQHNSIGDNLQPGKGGKYATILKHVPKPGPEWWRAKVIECEGKYYVNYYAQAPDFPDYAKEYHGKRNGIGWIGAGGGLCFADHFDGKTVNIVRKN